MQVTLVNPPYPEGSHRHPPFIPLGIGYLAAVLEKNGFEVNVIDLQALPLPLNEVESELRKRKPDLVGLTSTTLTYKSALRVIRVAKKALPECVTVIGGSHVTFWDENALKECPELDIVVRKEGENTLLEIVQRLESGKSYDDVIGLTCRKGAEIIKTEDRPYIENLDALPYPAFHLFPIEQFNKYGNIIFPLMTSRGCTFWCDFCSAVRMFGQRYRMRSPKKVVDELEFLYKKYGEKQYTFYDDAFTVNQKRTEELCDEILRRGLKIRWDCETRIDMVSKPLLEKMHKAGCIAVWYGVEAGSQDVRDAMGKGISTSQTFNAFKWTQEAGMIAVASIILGFPGETKETAMESSGLLRKLNPDEIGVYIATPYPGTPMYDYVKKMGWLRIHDFDRYDTATPIFESPNMTMQEIRGIHDKIHQSFYIRPTYILRAFRKGGVYGYSTTRTALAWLRRLIASKIGLR
ncbi:MAG: radical SAM protein [Candidatus Bathyarchaeota archaeon]|nr:radical SAM protein [Candidatus Bathyarchaeum tardum]WGM89998.1 MAG: radical SAM protein [Candidatus Bathyarchaeum tardum]